MINAPEEQHQCTEKGLKIVVLIDVTLIIQLDVSKHLQKTGCFSEIITFVYSSATAVVIFLGSRR